MNALCVQLGSRMYYAVPRILNRAGMLNRFHTDLLGDRGWPLALSAFPSALRKGAIRRLANRRLPDVPKQLVRTHPDIALRTQWRLSRARTASQASAAYIWAGDEICRRVIRSGLGSADAVFVIGSSSRLLFEAARRKGLSTINENIIAPPLIEKTLLSEEERRHPQWDAGTRNSAPGDFDALVRHEWDLSDLIVCGSEFVRTSVAAAGGPVERCVVIPYGLSQSVAERPKTLERGRALRVLTVGAIGLRKGSPYVLEAAKALSGMCEFRIVGAVTPSDEVNAELRKWATLTGTVSRDRIGDHYAWADVFLLPSVCEGSATVIYEALGHGLPVVTTPNAGSVIENGREGFLVPIRDVPAIIGALGALSIDEQRFAAMSTAALATAREYSFDRYATHLVDTLTHLGRQSVSR